MKKKKGKPVKAMNKILEYYFMTPEDITAKELSQKIKAVEEEKIEIWPELNLMEVVLEHDSLIFQDARECFIDPLDQEFLQQRKIKSMYQISFDERDMDGVRTVLTELMKACKGMVCSDTDDFDPIYTEDRLF